MVFGSSIIYSISPSDRKRLKEQVEEKKRKIIEFLKKTRRKTKFLFSPQLSRKSLLKDFRLLEFSRVLKTFKKERGGGVILPPR